jgi:hypothetical protein
MLKYFRVIYHIAGRVSIFIENTTHTDTAYHLIRGH